VNDKTKKPQLKSISIRDFLKQEFPPRQMLLDPIIATQSLTMIYSWRGLGKTNLALGMSLAISTGCKFLHWSAPKPKRVLYVDGEMPANLMQQRIKKLVRANGAEPPETHFRLVTPDLQDGQMPDLSKKDGQGALENVLSQGYELVVLDNLSTLCRTGNENEAESWGPLQEWLLSLRRKDFAVVALHHAGKGGTQRGTSRREDALDTVIKLVRPHDYDLRDGARFQLIFEKARRLFGAEMEPIEVSIREAGEDVQWLCGRAIDENTRRVAELHNGGLTQREIAKERQIGVGTVNRHVARAREAGLLEDDTPDSEIEAAEAEDI